MKTNVLVERALVAPPKAGRGGAAYEFCASAWSQSRVQRPDLAIRAVAELHGLVEFPTGEPVTVRRLEDEHDGGGHLGLDLYSVAPVRRHKAIFAADHARSPGGGCGLISDRDPKRFRYQYEAEDPNEHTREHRDTGPVVWHVRVGKALTLVAA